MSLSTAAIVTYSTIYYGGCVLGTALVGVPLLAGLIVTIGNCFASKKTEEKIVQVARLNFYCGFNRAQTP